MSSARRGSKRAVLRELQTIPGVGASIAGDLYGLGIRAIADLAGGDPEALYERSCALAGQHIDRCLLYTYRCAVYFASNTVHAPERLKWWNWKDAAGVAAAARRAASKTLSGGRVTERSR